MPTGYQTSKPIYEQRVGDILGEYENQQLGAQQGLPDISSLASNVPGLNVPGMDPNQQSFLQQLQANASNSSDMAAARAQLGELTSGPVGSSPATQAGMKAYYDLVQPRIESQSALRGTAGGGQGLEALSLGAEQAAVPLIQQEISDRGAAVGQYAALGNQQQQQLAQALEASGLPREVALQQAEAAFSQQQQQFQTQMGVQEQPASWIPATFGQNSTSGQHLGWMDYAGAIGKGIQGPLAGLFGGG